MGVALSVGHAPAAQHREPGRMDGRMDRQTQLLPHRLPRENHPTRPPDLPQPRPERGGPAFPPTSQGSTRSSARGSRVYCSRGERYRVEVPGMRLGDTR